jgi:hypothetical protein
MAHATIVALFNANADWTSNVPAKLNAQSDAKCLDLGIPMQSFVGSDGEDHQAPMTLKLADAPFKGNRPFKGELFAVEINPSDIRKSPKGDMMQCSNFKVLAVGDAAKLYVGNSTAEPSDADTAGVPFL